MCFAICLILNVNLTGGSNRAIFFLAPILLLLNQDADFVAGFGGQAKVFPCCNSDNGLPSPDCPLWHMGRHLAWQRGLGLGNWWSGLVLCCQEFGPPRSYIPQPYPFQQVCVDLHKADGLNAIDNHAP
ncbi:uncharacterized protein Pyn_12513 [Prunus yedoensis var. nudiflora]|uniref:Secreted protein n=1 Tax=Prunus yedoensis var. nudiflora TaxID=2094558 RepID=A0A314XWW2_PRUYE|nr:uncharacterized protein Pyn_12513 [Prunus yedoensis var. nudiflora]